MSCSSPFASSRGSLGDTQSPQLPQNLEDSLWLPKACELWEKSLHTCSGTCNHTAVSREAWHGELCMAVSWAKIRTSHIDNSVLDPGRTGGWLLGCPAGLCAGTEGPVNFLFFQILKSPCGPCHPVLAIVLAWRKGSRNQSLRGSMVSLQSSSS